MGCSPSLKRRTTALNPLRQLWVSGRRSVMNADALLHDTVHFSQPQQQGGMYERRRLMGCSIQAHQLSLLLPRRVSLRCLASTSCCLVVCTSLLRDENLIKWKKRNPDVEIKCSSAPPLLQLLEPVEQHSSPTCEDKVRQWERLMKPANVMSGVRALPNHHSHLVRFHNLCAALKKKRFKITDVRSVVGKHASGWEQAYFVCMCVTWQVRRVKTNTDH